jgi:hypothetical protein
MEEWLAAENPDTQEDLESRNMAFRVYAYKLEAVTVEL